MADGVTGLLNGELTQTGSPLREVDFGRFAELRDLGRRFLHRPLMYPESELRVFEADVLAVVDLLTSLPDRLFDGDPVRTCAALGLSPSRARLVGGFDGRRLTRFGRVEAGHDAHGLRLLSFDLSSRTAGWDWVGPASAAYAAHRPFREFGARHGLYHYDTTSLLAQSLRAAGKRVSHGPDPVVAVIEGPGGMSRFGERWLRLQAQLRAEGLECRVGELPELTVDSSGVRLRGGRIDVLYRAFDLDQAAADPESAWTATRLRAAHREGRVALWAPLETDLYRDRWWLAALGDPAVGGEVLTARERRIVERTLPWTRAVGPGPGAAAVLEECRDRRTELVLRMSGAADRDERVVSGAALTDRKWTAALRAAAGLGGIVQDRVAGRPEEIVDLGSGEIELWDARLDLFLLPCGLAGGGARLTPAGAAGGWPADPTCGEVLQAGIYLYADGDMSRAS